jgi:hypothetical protein
VAKPLWAVIEHSSSLCSRLAALIAHGCYIVQWLRSNSCVGSVLRGESLINALRCAPLAFPSADLICSTATIAACNARLREFRGLRKHLFGRFKRVARKAEVEGDTGRSGRGRSRSPAREEQRETSEERRERIAEWSRKRKEGSSVAA